VGPEFFPGDIGDHRPGFSSVLKRSAFQRIVGADARMRKGREQELRAKQEKFPLRDFLAKGDCVLKQGQA
jgi:hypothetical protein